MRYDDFKAAVYQIRDNRIEINRSLQRLRMLDTVKFDDLLKVVDYERERSGKGRGGTDDAIIDAIAKFNGNKARIARHIEELPEVNADIEAALWAVKSFPGSILIDYFVMGHKIDDIAQTCNYSTRQIYRLLDKGMEEAFYIHEAQSSSTIKHEHIAAC